MRFLQGKLWHSTEVFLLGVAVLCSACNKEVPMDTSGGQALSGLERDILREINRVRTDPAAYAATIETRKQQYDKQIATLGSSPAQSQTLVFEDAIRTLRATAPLPALTVSRGLSLAAKEHVGQGGSPPAAFEERLKRHGTWEGSVAENVAYGSDTAQRFVMQFVLDPDDARRTQRANILQSGFTMSGAACGPHPQYTTMCVVTFARKYSDKMP